MQYEVVFLQDSISEKSAHALLEQDDAKSADPVARSRSTSGSTTSPTDSGRNTGEASTLSEYTYEIMKLSSHQYLCSIPVFQPPAPENKTENELARAEEAREQARAAVDGWALLDQLEESCLYFGSGWWSYSFCKNREIIQYHALPSVPSGQPPRRDPNSAIYILGRNPTLPATAHQSSESDDPEDHPVPAELQIKGDQRYLVQRLDGGTICDLTGRERTIEVQYHCVPGLKQDRIGWIKEITICSYLMVVNTPRLCTDVAFLPPEPVKANAINCQLIQDGGKAPTPPAFSEPGGLVKQEPAGQQVLAEDNVHWWKDKELTLGGIVLGARNVLSRGDEEGKPPVKLPPARTYLPKNKQIKQQQQGADGEGTVQVVVEASSREQGGGVTELSEEELDKLGLKREAVEAMKKQMIGLAGDLGWTLELVELDDELRELRGYVDDVEGVENEKGKDKDKGKGKGEGKEKEGSEEAFYREEL